MRPRWLLLGALAATIGCSSDISNTAGRIPADPVRWRQAACIAGAPARPGDSREDLALRCASGPRGRDFIAVALSGGGTKAAVFSAESMFYLEALGLMPRTSVLSSVSGGSFAAALYAISCDPDDATCPNENVHGLRRPVWRRAEVLRTVGQGYAPLATEQIARWIVPGVKATIDAGRFAGFIDRSFFKTGSASDGRFRFADLNPKRPHLVLNATILSPNRGGLGSAGPNILGCVGEPAVARGWLRRRNPDEFFHFAYTDVYFGLLGSNLRTFPVSGAVAASAAFPVLIDNAVLEDHCRRPDDADRSLRLMDGGANDNQGMVEIYHILTEMILGQRRSGVPADRIEHLGAGDAAYIFVVNSSITDTTGPTGTGSGSGPLGPLAWISGVLSRVSSSVDVYSASEFNLRKEFYVSEVGRVAQAPRRPGAPARAAIWPVEIGLTGLDQYRSGGAQAALWRKSGLLDAPGPNEFTDPALRRLQDRPALHQAALGQLLPAATRRRLGLSDHHPQCYFDMRDRFDASLLGLSDDVKACLREAARWSTALTAQEICEEARSRQGWRAPDGLLCGGGGPVSLRRPEILGGESDIGGSCRAILDTLIAEQAAKRNGPPDQDACQGLPAD